MNALIMLVPSFVHYYVHKDVLFHLFLNLTVVPCWISFVFHLAVCSDKCVGRPSHCMFDALVSLLTGLISLFAVIMLALCAYLLPSWIWAPCFCLLTAKLF